MEYDFAAGGLQRFLQSAPLPLLSAAQEQELARRIAGGDREAMEQLVRSNLRLVVSIATHYSTQGLPLEDIIQEGTLGLMRAAQKFDDTRGFRFSTYATWWIRQAISRALAEHSHPIHIPVHVVELLYTIKRSARRLYQEQGGEALPEQLAAEVGLTRERVGELLTVSDQPLSLDAPMADDEQYHLADTLEGPSGATALTDQQWLLREATATVCTEREQDILSAHYGLNGRAQETFAVLAARYGLCKERIRQLEVTALKKIRVYMQRNIA